MPTRTEAHAELCGHYKSALTLAHRDLGDVARKAARAEQQGSPTKTARMLKLVQERKDDLASIKETIALTGPVCSFCMERARGEG